MNEMEVKNEIQKIKVFNVILLDRSGSMECIRQAAVEGFNETLAGIKKAQEKFADTQDHFVSLVTFCSCETKHLYDKTPVAEAKPLNIENFQPCCTAPLYDAMGMTLTGMHNRPPIRPTNCSLSNIYPYVFKTFDLSFMFHFFVIK